MIDCMDSIISFNSTIRESIAVIDISKVKMALVVGDDQRFLGTVTDGDIRRSILSGKSIDGPVSEIMNTQALALNEDENVDKILSEMRRLLIKYVPVLDRDGRIIGIKGFPEVIATATRPNVVVLMAGGQGKRLRPLTEDTPKPLLDVGGKPILQTIIEGFSGKGFKKFYLSVNYMADQIIDYFGNGHSFGVEIDFIREDRPLGTAGALQKISGKVNEPFFVMNGDILTNVPMDFVLNYHAEHQQMATMCVQPYSNQVPYGVVEFSEKNLLTHIREKPIYNHFVNAGIYILEPEALSVLTGSYMDMPDLLETLMRNGEGCAVCPIREYWMDIGKYPDYIKANEDFVRYFGGENV